MRRKIRYWLSPVWAAALLILLGELDSLLDPGISYLPFLFTVLPGQLLLLWSYIKGLKIFSLPRPDNKRFVITVLVTVLLLPLLLAVVYEISFSVFTSFNGKMLEPFYSGMINCAWLLCALLILRIAGLHLPRGKYLSMCFLPVLIFAAVGTVLILASGVGFWIDTYMEVVFRIIPGLYERFGRVAWCFIGYFVEFWHLLVIFFTVYWTLKYNHELPELAASQGNGEAVTNQKISYWLVPVWTIALFWFYSETGDVILAGDYDSGFVQFFYILFFLFLPLYLLLLLSCLKGFKLFSLPKPKRGQSLAAAFAALVLIPVFFFAAILIAEYVFWTTSLYFLLLSIALFFAALIILRILGIRPPRGKCLLMCFLPMLVFAIVGAVLVAAAFWGFDLDFSHAQQLTPVQKTVEEIVDHYFFEQLGYFCSYVSTSFTVYWTVKYHHEQSEREYIH